VTWQDGGVIVIVGAALAYVVRKFVLPPKPSSKAATFIPIQQVKARSKAKPDSR
jgi:hypothetical protein